MERLGEGKKPTAIIGEVADELELDLVVLSMEAIHSKHVDGNLLAEFIPCPVLLLPLWNDLRAFLSPVMTWMEGK